MLERMNDKPLAIHYFENGNKIAIYRYRGTLNDQYVLLNRINFVMPIRYVYVTVLEAKHMVLLDKPEVYRIPVGG